MRRHSASETAKIVARNIAMIAANEETAALVEPENARLNALFVENFSGGTRFLQRAGKTWFQKYFRGYERLTIPGLALHQALRKLYLEKSVRSALSEGFKQVVIIGGGFDTLALRLHGEFSEINFIEIDHPATQTIKQKISEKYRLNRANFHFLPLDLTVENLAETLKSSDFYDQNAPTVFVCEGVLMYLNAAEVDSIFDFLEQRKARSRFVFTFMEPDENGETAFRNSTFLVQLWLTWKKEPFRWSLAEQDRDRFFAGHCFKLNELINAEKFAEIYLASNRLKDKMPAAGEVLGVGEILRCQS